MAVTVLQKLAGLAVEPRYAEMAHESLACVQPMMAQYPLGFGQRLQALAYAPSRPHEVTLAGAPPALDMRALLAVLREGYRPHQIVALGDPNGDRTLSHWNSRYTPAVSFRPAGVA